MVNKIWDKVNLIHETETEFNNSVLENSNPNHQFLSVFWFRFCQFSGSVLLTLVANIYHNDSRQKAKCRQTFLCQEVEGLRLIRHHNVWLIYTYSQLFRVPPPPVWVAEFVPHDLIIYVHDWVHIVEQFACLNSLFFIFLKRSKTWISICLKLTILYKIKAKTKRIPFACSMTQ